MATFVQAGRQMRLTTPLPADTFLVTGLSGREEVSRLYRFQVDVVAAVGTSIAFDKLLGQPLALRLQIGLGDDCRWLTGICGRVSQGGSDVTLASYTLEMVPKQLLLARVARSRTFQQKSVPDILKEVLGTTDVTYSIQGTFEPRDYCVQYRETDFAFASRLMEEEGIFYFFKHTEQGAKMVVGNTPQAFADLPVKNVLFEGLAGGGREEDRVWEWTKSQEVRTAKWTLWDHCFEMPDKSLEAQKPVVETVTAGEVSHKLHAGELDKLETYDYPGAFAQRFDGVAPGGGDQASHLQKIFEDNQRTATIRVEAEESLALTVSGSGNVRQMLPGHKLELDNLPGANGGYVLTSVTHTAQQAVPASDGSAPFSYRNAFTALPEGARYRPQRLTERPVVHGTQTAVVVGPAGQEIFTDKYGRVKVQFHWDREGKKDQQSSCWIRVGTPWAGQNWGAIHIPRIGQEVIVAFLEGDPDQPIIVGSVYNADQMPPYTLPDNMTQSGVKSRSTLKGTTDHFNELRFEDKKDTEDVYFHAQKDFHRVVENDDDLKVGHDQTIEVKNHRTETVKEGNEKVTIEKGDRTIVVSTGNDTHTVSKGNRSVSVDQGNDTHDVKTGYREATVEGDEKLTVSTGNRVVKINTGNDTLTVQTGNLAIKVSAGKATIEAAQSIELKVGSSSIKVDPSGVTISGVKVSVEGQAQAEVKGGIVQVQGTGMVKIQGSVVMIN